MSDSPYSFPLSLRIGLTGSIGCGKTTALNLFQTLGWQTLNTDSVARHFLETDTTIHSRLRESWGGICFQSDGKVDRKAIAAKVFDDPEALRFLESLLHPLVRAYWETRLSANPRAGWVVEIPLLFEKKLETAFNFTVCLGCSPSVQYARLSNRGYSSADIEGRLARQLPLAEKIRRAEFYILNDGSPDFLKSQIFLLHAFLRERGS